jgi:hypothetical protein
MIFAPHHFKCIGKCIIGNLEHCANVHGSSIKNFQRAKVNWLFEEKKISRKKIWAF